MCYLKLSLLLFPVSVLSVFSGNTNNVNGLIFARPNKKLNPLLKDTMIPRYISVPSSYPSTHRRKANPLLQDTRLKNARYPQPRSREENLPNTLFLQNTGAKQNTPKTNPSINDEVLPRHSLIRNKAVPKEVDNTPQLQVVTKNMFPVTLRPLNLLLNRHLDDNEIADSNMGVTCGMSVRIRHYIANGGDIEEGAYPWIAALFHITKNELSYKCGGTLVSARHVITAGHCVVRNHQVLKNVAIVLGKTNVTKVTLTDDNTFKIEYIHVHPEYKAHSGDGDIAVLVLQRPAVFTSLIRPACLWSRNIPFERGTVVGWGSNEKGQLTTDIPKQVNIPVVPEETCLRSNGEFINISSNRTFCAGWRNGSAPCMGDSGSGFMVQRRQQWILKGVVSLSLGDDGPVKACSLSLFVVFVDVSKFNNWLEDIIKI